MKRKIVKKQRLYHKRVWLWMLLAALAGSSMACGTENGSSGDEIAADEGGGKEAVNGAEEKDTQQPQEEEADAEQSDVSIEPQVLADADGIKVTATGIEDGFYGPEIKIQIENNSEQSVMVQSRDVSVNGIMQQNVIFSCDVAAGKSANDELTFMSSELEQAGINQIGEVELKIAVSNADDWSDLFTTEAQQIQTSAYGSFEQTYDDSGFVAVDQDGYRIIIKKLDDEESFWGADIYIYAENNSDRDVTIQARDVSINGYMVNPMFSCDILSGKKAFDSITFLESDLKDNNIEDITDMELYFTVVDKNTFDTIQDTDVIQVSFE